MKKFIRREELVKREIAAALVVFNIVLFLSIIFPSSIKEELPSHGLVPAPWIFISIQLLLKYLPVVWAGIILPLLLLGMLFTFPYLARNGPTLAKIILLGVIVLMICFTIIGHFTIKGSP